MQHIEGGCHHPICPVTRHCFIEKTEETGEIGLGYQMLGIRFTACTGQMAGQLQGQMGGQLQGQMGGQLHGQYFR